MRLLIGTRGRDLSLMRLIRGAVSLACRRRLFHESTPSRLARVASRPALHIFLPQYWLFDLLSIQYLRVLHQIRQRALDYVLAMS